MKRIISILVIALMLLTACKSSKNASSNSSKEAKEPTKAETWIVGPEKVACAEGSALLCYQVKKAGESDYSLMNVNIEGFNFEAGNKYQIVVYASNGKYTLKEVLYKIANKQ